jgi:hypothetical protein
MKKYTYLLAIIALLSTQKTWAQTLKALSYDTSNNVIIAATNTNPITFRNPIAWATNSHRDITRTNLGLGTAATNPATAFQPANTNLTALASGDGSSLTNVGSTDASTLTNFPSVLLRTNGDGSGLTNLPAGNLSNAVGILALSNGGTGATTAGATRTNLGLGSGNLVQFLQVDSQTFYVDEGGAIEFHSDPVAGATRTNLGLGATWLTNNNVTNFRSAIGGTTVGNAVFTANGAATAANAIDLGQQDNVRFNALQFTDAGTQPTTYSELGLWTSANGYGGFYSFYDGAFKFAFAAGNNTGFIQDTIIFRTNSVQLATPLQFVGTNAVINAATTRSNLNLGATWLTNTTAPLFWASVPASPTNSGTAGQIAYTNNFLYICISNNLWRRVQLGTW